MPALVPAAAAAPPLPGFGLAPPSEADVLASLGRSLGCPRRAGAAWTAACSAAGVRVGGRATPEAMLRAMGQLGAQGGPAGVVGKAMTVRLRTYLLLSQRQGPPSSPSSSLPARPRQ